MGVEQLTNQCETKRNTSKRDARREIEKARDEGNSNLKFKNPSQRLFVIPHREYFSRPSLMQWTVQKNQSQ